MDSVVSVIEEKYGTEFALLRQLAAIPNLIPALSKLAESYTEPKLGVRKTLSTRPNTARIPKKASETLPVKEEGKKTAKGLPSKSRNNGPRPQATCPEPKKEVKKETKKVTPVKHKSSRDVVLEKPKKPLKEAKKKPAKEAKKVRPKSSRNITNKANNNDTLDNPPENNLPDKREEVEPLEEAKKEEIEKDIPPKFLELPKESPQPFVEPEIPANVVSIPIPAAEQERPSIQSENEVENKIILQKLLKSSLPAIHTYLPPQYLRQLPVLNREFLQYFVSKLLDQTRKQLVDNEKAINNIPEEIRENTHEEEEETFKLSVAAADSLEKIKDHNEAEFLEQANEKEKWLLGLVAKMAGYKENDWGKIKLMLLEKVVTGGLSKFMKEKMKDYMPTDEEVYYMKKHIGKNVEWLNEDWSDICKLILTAMKEGIKFAGVIDPTPRQVYQQAQYLFEVLSDTKDKIIEFAKSMKLTI